MSDRAAVVLAVVVWSGALWAEPVPRWIGVVLIGVALARSRPALLVVGAGLAASGLAAAAWAGLAPPPAGPVDGWATLVRDPQVVHGAVNVELRFDGDHLDGWARGPAGSALRGRLAGERVELSGRRSALSDDARSRLAPRHVAGRLTVEMVTTTADGSLAARTANVLRRRLEAAAHDLDQTSRGLLLGVVLGDRREQTDELADDFRRSGLSHLTAVSGENLAFVLALASPLLRRLDLRRRWALTIAVVAWFALLTRFEPSVMRASAMAGLTATAVMLGRPASAVRLLSLAVAAAVLVDPLIVHALGFRLSVAATAGIAVLAAPIARRLVGPDGFRTLLGVTLAAQVGVLPVAIPAFGGVPLASVPANVLAVPAAAPLTTWGLTGGLLADRFGPPVDGWLQAPTVVLTHWLAAVARWAAGLPLGQVGASEVGGVLAVLAFVVSARWSWRWAGVGSTRRRGPS